MSLKVLVKHGTTAEVAGYTGVSGELVVNADTSMLHIMDGAVVGGHPIMSTNFTVESTGIIAPLNNSTGIPFQPIIQGSAFQGDGEHAASYWQIATDSGFTNLIYDGGRETTRLLQLNTAEVGVTLLASTQYYVRVKYESSFGLETAWSSVVGFTVRVAGISGTLDSFITPTTVNVDDYFGYDVSTSDDGTVSIIGMLYNDYRAPNAGAVNIRKVFSSGGAAQQRITVSDGASNDYFGKIVAISGDGLTAAVTNQKGNVYIYYNTSEQIWTLQTKLSLGLNAVDGVALSYDGNTLVTGIYNDANGGTNRGVAYIHFRSGSTWAQQAKLSPSNPGNYYYFGSSVDITTNGDMCIIGSRNEGADASGAAYVFTRSGTTWTQQARLVPSSENGGPIANGFFGTGIAISADGSTAVIAAGRDADIGGAGLRTGAVYVFVRSGTTWSKQKKIKILTGDSDTMYFGEQITLSGDGNTLVSNDSNGSSGSGLNGRYYVYKRVGTVWSRTITVLDPVEYSLYFGFNSLKLSRDGNTLLGGLQRYAVGGVSCGAVAVYK